VALLAALLSWAPGTQAGAQDACTACHGNADFFDADGLAVVESFRDDVHAAAGLSCHDCHGGNPAADAEDIAGAMDEGFADNPYRGRPERKDVPGFCGRCHSDIGYMRRFDPRARVDQEQEYWTSRHGQRLRSGDEGVATCVDCHGAHGVKGPDTPSSPVHPQHVAETCRGCHADPDRMAGRRGPDGNPIPIDQYAKWRQSVHAAALLDREDLSAPTCNDCHGNHGATPPGLHSISFVCGQCHGREAEVFRASAKWEAFEMHGELLAEAGEEGCAACHDALPEQALQATSGGFSECSTCHGNHAVVKPSVAMLSPLPETPCAFCHGSPGVSENEVLEPESERQRQQELESALVASAREAGLSGDALFDRLVDEALALPVHTSAGPDGPELKPAFARLATKFRIGKTHYTYEDPATGETVQGEIVRCAGCHSEGSAGLEAAATLLDRMRELTVRTARAERILLLARRGGVETGETGLRVDQAVNAQISAQVLVHGFDPGDGTPFHQTLQEGLSHASDALDEGQAALEELGFRRLGLAVALGFVILVLVALGLKIRELPP
jgi:hypothetical protein